MGVTQAPADSGLESNWPTAPTLAKTSAKLFSKPAPHYETGKQAVCGLNDNKTGQMSLLHFILYTHTG